MTEHPFPEASPRILVLTPVKNAARHLQRHFELIQRLNVPRERLSIGLLESDSTDGTFEMLQAARPEMEARCRRVTLVKRDFGFRMPPGVPRWAPAYQLVRRSNLARSRNQLLFRALRDEDWVVWIDVDVIDYPADLVERLLACRLEIVHPHCVIEPGGKTFDLNAWSDQGTRTMDGMRGTGQPVRLDAVGGTVLMIKADLHRDGLIFPPFRYGAGSPTARDAHPLWGRGEVETEGLGIMAHDMGLQCWGLPDLEVVHAPE
jgi:peptide chain release factor subunit 1